jgi:hypothetical protein
VKLSCGFGFGNLKQIDFLQLARIKGGSGQSPASTTAILAHLNLTVRIETTHQMLFDRKWQGLTTCRRRLECCQHKTSSSLEFHFDTQLVAHPPDGFDGVHLPSMQTDFGT